MRTIQELAKEALAVQNACNLSGISLSFSKAMSELRDQPECTGTKWMNEHPITRIWVDKLASLAGVQDLGNDNAVRAFGECERLAKEG